MAASVLNRHYFALKKFGICKLSEKCLPSLFDVTQGHVCRHKDTRSFCMSSIRKAEDDQDAICHYHEKLFSSFRVQQILTQITGFDVNKIFHPKQGRLSAPRYQFMTNEELKQAQKEAENRGHQKLRMPAFLRRREKIPLVISRDPEVQGLIPNNLVCVDISPGQRSWSRVIVVREPNGTLREATHSERTQANQVFFPKKGREINTPTMFQPEHLEVILKRGDYLFVLERACCQFELNDPQFTRVTETTFRHIAQTKSFDVLRSTRHFGPMAFFLVTEKNVDTLMMDMIQQLLVDDAVDLVELFCLAHAPEKWTELAGLEDKVQILKHFAAEHCQKGGQLELLLQSLKEHLTQKQASN